MDRTQIELVQAILLNMSNHGKRLATEANTSARTDLLNSTAALRAALETPAEFVSRTGMAEPARDAVVRTAINLRLFDILAEQNASITVGTLAERSGADPVLIARMMKHLAAMQIVRECGVKGYAASPLSKALANVLLRDSMCHFFDEGGPSFQAMPEFLKKTRYRNPNDITNSPFGLGFGTDKSLFTYFSEHPEAQEHFNNTMTGFREGKATWLDFYPVQDQLLHGAGQEGVLLVDVGGGVGHDSKAFCSRFPDTKGTLVLQDQAVVIESLSKLAGIEATVHDFFTPQPVQHARAYYLHSVLHDWDDESCVKILSHLRDAMKSGHSKLLINEYVVPDQGATWPITSIDLLMMVLRTAEERTETQWSALLDAAGFRLVKVYMHDQDTESLIEAELAK